MALHFSNCVLASMALITPALAFHQDSKLQVASSFHAPTIQIDHAFDMDSLPGPMQQALDIVRNVQTLPSCAKVASSALLHSCSALEGSIAHDEDGLKRGSDLFIEEEGSLYAARLAVCELNGAELPIPGGCQAFVPTQQIKKKRGIRGYWTKNGPSEPTSAFDAYDEITSVQLKRCLSALGSSHTSWVSYSNNKQNAVAMCRAMRSEIEKDEQLQVAKVLAETVVTASGSLKDASEQINDLKAEFRKLATAMPQFQVDLAAGNEQQLQHVAHFWAEVERVRAGLVDIATGMEDVRDGLQGATDNVSDLQDQIAKTAVTSVAEVKSKINSLNGGVDAAAAGIDTLSQLTSYHQELLEQKLTAGLFEVSKDLDAVNNLMPTVRQLLTDDIESGIRWLDQRVERQMRYEETAEQTNAAIEAALENAALLNASIGSIHPAFGLGWPLAHAWLQDVGMSVGSSLAYTLLSYGLWEKYAGFSLLGNLFASIGSGVLAHFYAPNELYQLMQQLAKASASEDYSILTLLPGVLAVSAAYALYLVLKAMICSVLARLPQTKKQNRTDALAEYDPTSPQYPIMERWSV